MALQLAADVKLVERMAAGDRSAHEELCDRHRLSLYAQAYALLVDAASAEKVVEEGLERAWHAAQHFNPGAGSPFSWLSEIVRSIARHRRNPPGPAASPRASA
jgi:DNA-directed RNA polymerase specialized sigma24 family protein